MPKQISPKSVRYIKLGKRGGWEAGCLEDGIIRLGFGTEKSTRFQICQQENWEKLQKSFVDEGEALREASRFKNEVRHFFEDDGTTLWITFHADLLYWGFLTPTPPKRHVDGGGIWRTVLGGWKCQDLAGTALTKGRLSAALTKLAIYQGTSCSVRAASYIVRKINGKANPKAKANLTPKSKPARFADEVDPNESFPEGAIRRVLVNAYERSQKAKRRCIRHHGSNCFICGFDFGANYGKVANGFIHVHHLCELSQIATEYEVDPVEDLRPVCPNCHAVLHRRKPAFSIDDVKAFLKKTKRRA